MKYTITEYTTNNKLDDETKELAENFIKLGYKVILLQDFPVNCFALANEKIIIRKQYNGKILFSSLEEDNKLSYSDKKRIDDTIPEAPTVSTVSARTDKAIKANIERVLKLNDLYNKKQIEVSTQYNFNLVLMQELARANGFGIEGQKDVYFNINDYNQNACLEIEKHGVTCKFSLDSQTGYLDCRTLSRVYGREDVIKLLNQLNK